MLSSKQVKDKSQAANESPTGLEQNLDSIKEWQRKQPHLNFVIDDQLIQSFLRCSKFSIERTKEKIDNYFTIRALAADILSNRDPFSSEIQTILNAGVILPLPSPDNDGCRIMLGRYGSNLNAETMHCSNIVKVYCMVLDILLMEDNNSVTYGLKAWSDCQGSPLQYATQVTPSFLKKCTYIGDKGLPFRVKGIYGTHCPLILEFVHNMIKVFLPKKLAKRMFLFNETSFEQFYTKIPQHLLPVEYGGRNGSIKELTVTWKEKIESYREWFIENDQFKSNEELRQGKSELNSSMFGLNGSFRKLEID